MTSEAQPTPGSVDSILRELPPAAPESRDTAVPFALGVVEGEIVHRRRRPKSREFRYAAFCLRVPLSRLPELEGSGIAWNRAAAIAFHDRDQGKRDGSALATWIENVLAAERVKADGEVVLYAFPRMLGYVFNPASFWVCHDRQGAPRAVLCDVANTFGERHAYLLAHPDGRAILSGETLAVRKALHVSPYCEVKGRYTFLFHFAAHRWLARIDYFDDEGETLPILETWFAGRVDMLSPLAARRLVFRYPMFTLLVIARIRWQHARLWLRRLPRFAKPAPPQSPLSRGG